jgi:hypothetical protein
VADPKPHTHAADPKPSAAVHHRPSTIVPPPTHRRAVCNTAPGAPPSTGVGGGDSMSVLDLMELWGTLSLTMHCPDIAAVQILFIITDEVHDALLEHAVTGSRQAPCPRTSYSTSIWSGSGCMAHAKGFATGQRCVELLWSHGVVWDGGIWWVIGEIDVETDVLDI